MVKKTLKISGKINKQIFQQGQYYCFSVETACGNEIHASGNLCSFSKSYSSLRDVDLCFSGYFFNHHKYGKQFRFNLVSLSPDLVPIDFLFLISTPYSKRAYIEDKLKQFSVWDKPAFKTLKSACLELYSKPVALTHIHKLLRHISWAKLLNQIEDASKIDASILEDAFIKTPIEHIEDITKDPFQLVIDRVIDFKTAETLCQKPTNLHTRDIAASIDIIESLASRNGDTFISVEQFISKMEKKIGRSYIPDTNYIDVFEIDGNDYIQTSYYKKIEQSILDNCNALYKSEALFNFDSEDILNHFKSKGKEPTQCQLLAAEIITNKFSVITGLPGTGKTTIVESLTACLEQKDANFVLTTPTGTAAMRLGEVTGYEAKTIHSLLGALPTGNGFIYNKNNKLDVDWIIIDEGSMIDMFLFSSLIQAIPEHAGVTLLGDIDQIASIREGAILRDLYHIFPSVRMTTTKRFDKDGIIKFCHAICSGKIIKSGLDGLKVNEAPDENTLYSWTRNAVDSILSVTKKTGLQHVQILAPQYAGENGIDSINEYCRTKFYGDSKPVELNIANKTYKYHIGSKILIKANMPSHNIYNGDIGFIIDFPGQNDAFVTLSIRKMEVVLSLSEARNMIPGYCISIHNAQGQEYPYCLTVITKKGAKLLSRNLVNSAISRGQKAALVVAESGALEICASRTDSTRNTRLIYLEAEKKIITELEGKRQCLKT
tara:strand:- start:763 stop:2910 length:2148 start_codon:yes stop_codon:yes gene_type:complete